jgi:putative DNA primase/helicase
MPDWLIELAKPQPKDTAHDNAPDTVAVAPDLQGAIAAMRVCCASDKPENDGSKRLLTYVCRGREHGLSAEQTIQVVRMVAADKPFPKDWSDAEIIKRYADAGNMVEDGSAIRRSSLWQQEERTDAGNAKRFAKRYGDKIRWDESRKCWFVWNGKCWQKDNTCQVERSVKEFAQSLWDDASQIIANPNANSELKKAVVAFCKMSNSAGGIGNVVRLAKSEPGIAIAPKQFDTDQYLFNVANGTVDLRTGELKPPDPADLITRYVDTPYDVNATCPTLFLKFVNDIFDGNQNLVALLQRYFGYCLTGDVREQTLLILHGDGSNGKTVLVTIIQFIFGGYAGVAPEKLLAVKKWDAHPAEVAKLFGKRLIVAAETDKNTQLSEARVKLLTGSDRLSARGMNENWWDFDPTHKILLMTNHRPKVTGTDFAIWRRLKLLPFNVKFWRRSKGESGPAALEADETLIDKLKPEAPGILNWFVQGCLEWQKRGLEMPPEVLAATEEYRTSEDKLARFIKECCDVAPDAVELATEITNAYTEFTGKRIDDYQDFVGMMEAKGFKKDKPTSGEYRKKTVWHGLRLKVGVDNELLKV